MKNSREIGNYSIFGEYKQDENRVTAALLHILKQGGEELINYILTNVGNTLPESEISVHTQTKKEGYNSVPDGELFCNFSFKIIIESKVAINAVDVRQLEDHRKRVVKEQAELGDVRLMYLTPDSNKPISLSEDEMWFSWQQIVDILKKYIDENSNELLTYLVGQFILLIENMGLANDFENRVIVVGGSYGEKIALEYGFYACQNHRHFSPAKYLAFAHQNRIKYLFEITEDPRDNVDLRNVLINTDYFDKYDPEYSGKRKIFKLKLLQTFDPVIENDTRAKNGKICAFTQKQKYISYDSFEGAKYTSDLSSY